MGTDAPDSILACVDLKDMLQNSSQTGCNTTNGSSTSWRNNVLVAEDTNKSKRSARVFLRRARLEGCRRRKHTDGIDTRVNTLKRLIPKSDSTGLEGLFKETADYILSLQTRVTLMQLMLHSFTSSANLHH